MFSHQDNLFSLVDALSAIRLLSRLPVEGVTEQELIARALDVLPEYQEVECSSLFLLDGGMLRCAAGIRVNLFGGSEAERYADEIRAVECAADQGIMGQSCQTRQLQYYRNCKEETAFTLFDKTWLSPAGGALMSIPVLSDDKLLGVLNVSSHLPEFFETWHQHFLMLFASVLGRFLHQQRLVTDARQEVDALRRALARVDGERK
ncbi:MAG: GAF domain-containing protein [Sedimenticola sp.]|nr:GAF domain-containing protein [Sedimenticola sp.]